MIPISAKARLAGPASIELMNNYMHVQSRNTLHAIPTAQQSTSSPSSGMFCQVSSL